MRIISQDGALDIPYENVVVYQDIKEIMCIFGGIYIGRTLAKYSTEAKAQKAMEMLRNGYLDFMSEATPDGNGFCFNQPKIFQFPKDEDLEE